MSILNGAATRTEKHSRHYNSLRSKAARRLSGLYLTWGANINAGCSSRFSHTFGYGSALQAASGEGHETVVRLLLGRGADCNALAENFYKYISALHAASENGHEATVRLLLGHGANVNAKVHNRFRQYGYGSALAAASGEGHKAIVQLLLDRGADVDGAALRAACRRIERDPMSPWYASSKVHGEIMRMLLDRGVTTIII